MNALIIGINSVDMEIYQLDNGHHWVFLWHLIKICDSYKL